MTASSAPPTGLQVAQLVSVRELALRLVVGAEWAGPRIVSWAHATEMVDPRPHLREAELVCTVGSALITAENCARFVEAVHSSASSGICLGIGEVHTQTPPALISECQRLSVPLIEMAHGAPFLAINDVLAEARITAQTNISERDGRLLGKLLATVRESASVDEILSMSAELLGGRLRYKPRDRATGATQPPPDRLCPESEALSITTSDGGRLTWEGDTAAPHLELLSQVARVLEIARHEKLALETQNRQRVGQLFALVANGLADPAALTPELQGAALVGKTLIISAWPTETAPLLATHLPGALIADAPEATYVVTTSAEEVRKVAHELGLVCGHASPVEVSEIARGITESRATLLLARNAGKVTGPERLTSLAGLLEQQPPATLIPFVDQLIRPIVEHDSSRQGQLLSTLRSFIENRASLQATASARYLHVNTVRHRLGRVAEITGRNPLDYQDQVSLAIALWSYDRSRRYLS